MMSDEDVVNVLMAIAVGDPDRATGIVSDSTAMEGPVRDAILMALAKGGTASSRARNLGDTLRALAAPGHLVNECYRVAFYSGDAWRGLSANPLFAYFLANRSGRLLDKWPHYFPIYHHHLQRFRGRDVRVLEIGVYHGGGLRLLRHYLGDDAQIVGIDIDENAARAAGEGYVIEIGDQRDATFLRAVTERHGPWDIVIDDGGHSMQQQIASVVALFPLLEEGGVYLVEDCHTSYWPEYQDSEDPDQTFLRWVSERIDDVNAHHHSRAQDLVSPWATALAGIHVYDSVVVFDKADRFAPFSELSGTSDYVNGGRKAGREAGDMRVQRDAAVATRDAAVATSEAATEALEALRVERAAADERSALLAAQLAATRDELALLSSDLRGSEAIVEEMRNSTSWRVTEPLRRIRASLSRG